MRIKFTKKDAIRLLVEELDPILLPGQQSKGKLGLNLSQRLKSLIAMRGNGQEKK